MEHQKFDQITRQLALGGNRRGFMAGAVGAFGGVIFGARPAVAVTVESCFGKGFPLPGRSGGNSGTSNCYAPKECYFHDGELLNCSFFGFPYQKAQGGKSGCCLPDDLACINAIESPPPPGNCTYA